MSKSRNPQSAIHLAIIDYGMGNLRSAQKAFKHVGAEAVITQDPAVIGVAAGVVLPGDGAFGAAMHNLRAWGLVDAVYRAIDAGKPFLGICVGQQLLFEFSEEMGQHAGLGIFRGRVRRFPHDLTVPHMGWNQLHLRREVPLLAGVPSESFTYFIHSYYVDPEDTDVILATTDYGIDFASIVGRDHVWGIQFHPEKSQDVGLQILENFVRIVERKAGTNRG